MFWVKVNVFRELLPTLSSWNLFYLIRSKSLPIIATALMETSKYNGSLCSQWINGYQPFRGSMVCVTPLALQLHVANEIMREGAVKDVDGGNSSDIRICETLHLVCPVWILFFATVSYFVLWHRMQNRLEKKWRRLQYSSLGNKSN